MWAQRWVRSAKENCPTHSQHIRTPSKCHQASPNRSCFHPLRWFHRWSAKSELLSQCNSVQSYKWTKWGFNVSCKHGKMMDKIWNNHDNETSTIPFQNISELLKKQRAWRFEESENTWEHVGTNFAVCKQVSHVCGQPGGKGSGFAMGTKMCSLFEKSAADCRTK